MDEERTILCQHSPTDVQIHKLKRLLQKLKNSTGQGTSMISLILPPKDQLSQATKLLTTEYGTASNIKSRTNRLSVLQAITSASNRLKSLNKVPPNGLAVYSGNILISSFKTSLDTILKDKKEKKITFAIEPILPINTSLYMCDSKFHVDSLLEQFQDTETYGFLIIDGSKCIWSKLQGNTKTILNTITVDLPKKHGRGGQSSVRFARIRVEKRNAYVKKVVEITNNIFGEFDGYIFAGPADFKLEIKNSPLLKPIIGDKIIKLLDTNYGGDTGLKQAIEMANDVLKDVKFNKERLIINELFDAVRDQGNYSIGKEVFKAIEEQAIDKLIIFDELEMEIDGELVLDYLERLFEEIEFDIKYVSNKTAEGAQFVSAFGGLAALTKFKVSCIDTVGENESFEEDDSFF
ncbi:Eukaryotic peptide chain release factor subunit 1-2 [Cucumispora dikerogammari]|nr:Eukaryotic peptide chain release factor subunit 1-2 [Cucumispora dikerogammari]